MDQWYPNRILLHETVVVFRGPPSVGQFITGHSWHLPFCRRSLVNLTVSEEKLWHMHVTYGASVRNLFEFADMVDAYNKKIISEIERVSAKGLDKLLFSSDDSPYNSNYLMLTGPMPSDRTAPERKVISQYVLEECCRRILKDDVEELGWLHGVLRNGRGTAASAGMIFKYRAHQYLREGMVLELSPLHVNASSEDGDHIQNGRMERFTLPKMEENLVEGGTVRTHDFRTYFQLRSVNSPAVDWCTLVWPDLDGPPTFLAFRASSDVEGHSAKPIGLDNKLGPVDTERCLVVFTPKAVEPQATALITHSMEGGCGVHEGLRVFHCKISLVELFRREKPVAPLV